MTTLKDATREKAEARPAIDTGDAGLAASLLLGLAEDGSEDSDRINGVATMLAHRICHILEHAPDAADPEDVAGALLGVSALIDAIPSVVRVEHRARLSLAREEALNQLAEIVAAAARAACPRPEAVRTEASIRPSNHA